MSTCFLVILLYLINFVKSGTIQPSGSLPISNSIANCNQQADYTFSFIPETSIPAQGMLVITFPNQYDSNLGISVQTSSTCSVSCSISGQIVTFTFPTKLYNGSAYNVTVYGISNPSTSGGTGMFILKSYTGQNLLDENYIFGVIGIADAVNLLTNTMVSLKSGGVSTAGAFTTYLIRFKTASYIPWNSYIKITIPIASGFVLTKFPPCSSYPIYNVILPGILHCETSGSDVMVTGFNDNIQPNTDSGILISMQNPSFTTTTDVFKVAIYRGGTQLIYDWVNDISGVSITSGTITGISLTKINPFALQTKNKVMDYELRFTLPNVLTSSSVISIIFPATFYLVYNTNYDLYYVNYGLEDINEYSTVYLNVVSANQILISNFLPTSTYNEISLILRMVNPNAEGYTTPLKITTYTNSSQLTVVDTDVVTAKTTILDYTSTNFAPTLLLFGITVSNSLANGALTDLSFQIKPVVAVPAGGYFKIRIPDGFKIAIPFDSTQCWLYYSLILTWKSAQGCVASGNVITIWNNVDLTYKTTAIGQFKVTQQVYTPVYNSTFLFDIETYDVDGIRMLESYADYLTITANTIVFSNVVLLGNSVQNSILDISFNTIQALPAASPQYKASDIQGRIELIFLTTGWATDLGTGLTNGNYMTCKAISGIVGINGEEITCQLLVATLPRITVKNFQRIPANTPVRIQVIYIVPPTGSHTVKLSVISLKNRIYSNLNEVVLSFTAATTGAGATTTTSITYSSNLVNSYFDLTFVPNFGGVTAGSYIIITLPSYDTKFIQLDAIISCYVQIVAAGPFISLPCISYYNVDWILIQTSINLASTNVLKITNLQWPRYVPTLTITFCFLVGVITGNSYTQRPGSCALPVNPIPNSFNLAMIAVPKKGLGYVDCTYTFSFLATNTIPANSNIVLTFPTTYSLIDSSPAPIFTAPLLSGYNGYPLQFTTTANQLIISNIDEYPANTLFTIIATGIKNPSSGTVSSGWTIQVFYNSALVNQLPSFFSFPFDSAFVSGYVIINQINAFPVNADEYADYTIVFTPQTDIPSNGIIQVTFPGNQYKELPGNLECDLSGGIQTFYSCILSSTTIIIVIGEKYSSGVGSIYLTIKNIKNPDAGTTDGFIISTIYDGVTLDVTDQTTLTGRTFTSIATAQPLTVLDLSFDPQNEGEESVYNFTFVPSDFVDSANQFMIQFPDDYHPTLGRSIVCTTYSGLVGDISCSVSNRGVYITNFETYLPSADKPVGILIYGVINPNWNNDLSTGYFKIGTQVGTTAKFIDYESQAGVVITQSAPGWATLYNVTTTNVYARTTSTYTFDFKAFTKIPKTSSLGKIYVDFPSQFTIPDETVICDTTTSSFATLITCSISRNRVSIIGQTADYEGEIFLELDDILNPIDSGASSNINVRTYDGLNKIIIERSFDNLDPFNFVYSYPGPLIIVNGGNDIYIERGTQTPNLYFTFDYPCRLNITLKPDVPGFSLIPYENAISVGMLSKKFRVSVPMSFYDGEYYITWTTLNDLNQYYTPLKETKVVVTMNGGNLLAVNTILDIPFGGQSLMTFITTPYSPDIGITISVNFLTQYKGLSLDKTSIELNPGMNSVNFTVLSSTDPNAVGTSSQKGTLSLILDGVNKDIFALPFSTIDFYMVAADTIAPLLNSFGVYNISQTNVFISISVNEPVHLFYMIALAGTLPPSFAEVQSQGPAPYPTTLSNYGFAVLTNSATTPFIFIIDGLTANTDYILYAYLQDRGFNNNSIPYNITFTTNNIYSAADFEIRLNQPTTDSYDMQSICDSIAFILSLNRDRVQERKYILSSTSRLLSSTLTKTTVSPVSTTLNLQILAMPNNAYFPSPKNLAASLINSTTELSARISNFDTTFTIPYSEVPRYKPKFIGNALLVNYTYYTAEFTFSLNNYGWGYIVAIRDDQDNATTYPSPYQISMGYNQYNIPVDSYGFIEVSAFYTDFNITIDNLDSETLYNAYISAGSANPGYPDMMDAKYVQKITFFTDLAPEIERLDINGAYHMGFQMIYIFIIIMMISFF